MPKQKSDSNSGVEAQTGFAFQRNCAIFFILENYDIWAGGNFFICIEHHDDLIFAHANSSNEINKIQAYQAKKSQTEWSTGKKLAQIVAKMTLVGDDLNNDPITKSSDYSHDLAFLTNKKIILKCGKQKPPKYTEIIRESNVCVCYTDLHQNIQNNLLKKLDGITFENTQLNNVFFKYIDVANTDKSQQLQLVGMLSDMFKDKIADHSAALDLLLKLFRNVETVYNQGNQSKLLDESKRVYSRDIFNALDIICNKAKAYKLWRNNADKLANALQISVTKGRNFREHLNNCFDYFKDLKQVEFQKIFHFVNENRDVDDSYFSESDCIEVLNERYLNEHGTQLDQTIIAFAIIAAYVETRNEK